MEGTSANTPEPAPKNSPSEQKPEDKETFEIKAGPVQLKGTQRFILTLILGLLGGVLILYLILFELKKPETLYLMLVKAPISQTLTAIPPASTLPVQTVVVTKEVTQFVTIENVIKETVIVTKKEVITKLHEVIITEIVYIPTVIIETPLPTATPQPDELLKTGLAEASWCGEIALDYLGGKTFQDSDDNIKLRIINYWSRSENFKCLQIWVDADARDRFVNELVKLLKHFKIITYVKWEADFPQGYQFTQTKNPYILPPLATTLIISGDYQCPPPTSTPQLTNTQQITSTPQIVETTSDHPFTFTVRKMTVEVQQALNRIVMKTWIPEDDVLQLLREKCP